MYILFEVASKHGLHTNYMEANVTLVHFARLDKYKGCTFEQITLLVQCSTIHEGEDIAGKLHHTHNYLQHCPHSLGP